MNGRRSSAYSRVFLVLGGLVVAVAILRVVRAFVAIGGAVNGADAGPAASRSLGVLSGGQVRILLACLAAGAAIVITVCVGALRRRSWALGASVALLGAGAAAGLGVASFQLAALLRGGDRTPEALEIGYGPVLSYWRIASVIVGVIVALFCAAALRRFLSEETRREFRG